MPELSPSPASASPALSIRNLKYRYAGKSPLAASTPADPPWIVDIDTFDLAQGEQVLLTGGSGSGKSTLLHLIAGLADPTSGHVLVSGQNMHTLRGAARDTFRGRSVGMIFQTFNLLHGFSALENVMAALMFSSIPPAQHAERAAALLKELGVERTDAEPAALSVGQQQRVAVARAVATGPALVLADEPTASLDPENAASAMDLIQRVCREKNAALLCVSHDPAMRSRFAREAPLASLRSRPA